MLPLLKVLGPAALAAGGAIAQGLINKKAVEKTNQMNYQIATEANQSSAAQSEKQMEFQREMSNTAYQRAMGDMKAAGLNPLLAYAQGGASTPAGSQGTVQKAEMQAPQMQGLDQLGSAAQMGVANYEMLQNNVSQRTLQSAQTQQANTQANKNIAEEQRTLQATALDLEQNERQWNEDARNFDKNSRGWNQDKREQEYMRLRKRKEDLDLNRQLLESKRNEYNKRFLEYDEWNRRVNAGAKTVATATEAVGNLMPSRIIGKAIDALSNSAKKNEKPNQNYKTKDNPIGFGKKTEQSGKK